MVATIPVSVLVTESFYSRTFYTLLIPFSFYVLRAGLLVIIRDKESVLSDKRKSLKLWKMVSACNQSLFLNIDFLFCLISTAAFFCHTGCLSFLWSRGGTSDEKEGMVTAQISRGDFFPSYENIDLFF